MSRDILKDRLASTLKTIVENTSKGTPMNKKVRAAMSDARVVLQQYDSKNADYLQVLVGMPLTEALWWFIENVSEDDPRRNGYYFALRNRMSETM